MDIYEKLNELVKKKIKGKVVTPESNLKDLGLDSLDKADILINIEDTFNILFTEEEMLSVTTVESLKNLIEQKIK